MDQYIKDIATQINYKELLMSGFKFVYSNKDLSLTLRKGKKYLVISLDRGKDLYNIRKVRYKGIAEIIEDIKTDGLFCDQIADIIEEWFKFNYINKPSFS